LGSRNGKPLLPGLLEEIFREHAAGLAGAARGILGRDCDEQELLQEAFLRAWRALERGDAPDDPVAWVFVLTLNLARDQRRRRGRRGPTHDLDEVDDVQLIDRRTEPLEALAGRETLAAARAAIFALDDAEKEVFLLRVSGGLSFEAVGQALAIPVGTAKTRMRKALRQLRQHLSGYALEAGIEFPEIELRGEAR